MSIRDAILNPVHSPWRRVLAAAAVVAAAAHVPVVAPHLDEARYMGVLFVVLTTACVVLAAAALTRDSRTVYALAALTCGLAIIGYAATRLVAFPELDDDVGNWLEPLGVLAIVAELTAVTAAVNGLRAATRPHRADPATGVSRAGATAGPPRPTRPR